MQFRAVVAIPDAGSEAPRDPSRLQGVDIKARAGRGEGGEPETGRAGMGLGSAVQIPLAAEISTAA